MKSSYITYITWFVILVFTLQSLTVYADITGNTLQQQTRLRQPEFIKAAIRIVEAASRDQEQAGILLSELAERLPSDIPAMIVYQPDSQTVYIADGTVIVSVRKAGSNTSQALPPLATLLQEERIGDVEIKILKDNMATRAELAALENVQIICKRDQQTDLAAKGQNALGVVLSGGALGAMLADEPALSLVMLALSVLFWGLPVIGMVKRRKVRKKKARPAAAGTHSRKAGPAKEKDGNLPVIPGTDSILAQEDALLRVVAEYPDILCYKYELYSTLGTAYQQQALACGIKGSVEEARVMQERAVAYFRQAVWAYYHGRAVPLLREDMQAAGERLSSSGVVNPDLVIDKLVALADEVEETEGDDELDRLRELLPEGLPEGTDVVWGIMGELAGAELSEEEREIEETVYALERCVLGRSEGYAEMAVLVCQDNGRLLAGLPFELVHAFMVVVFNSASLAREEKLQVFNTIRTCEKAGIAHLRAWSCSYIGQILVEQGSHNQALVVLLQGIGLVEGAFDTNIPLSQWILRALYFYSALLETGPSGRILNLLLMRKNTRSED